MTTTPDNIKHLTKMGSRFSVPSGAGIIKSMHEVLYPEKVINLIADYEANDEIPHIVVNWNSEDDCWESLGGTHRLAALKLMGRDPMNYAYWVKDIDIYNCNSAHIANQLIGLEQGKHWDT